MGRSQAAPPPRPDPRTDPRTDRRPEAGPAAGRWSAALRPALAVTPLICLAVAVPVLRAWPSNSDAAAQQSVLLTWLRVGHGQAYLPTDTWALKFPLYLVVENLPLASATRILVEAATLDALMYVLLAAAAWWFAGRAGGVRRWYDVVLPLAWLATVGGGMGRDLSTGPNYRNVEMGLSFALLALAGRHLAPGTAEPGAAPPGRWPVRWHVRWPVRWHGRALAVAVPLVLALLYVDDPYFLYLLALPLLLGCLVAAVLPYGRPSADEPGTSRRTRLLQVAAVVAASLAVAPALRAALGAAGVTIMSEGTTGTLQPTVVLAHVRGLWTSVQAQLGDRGRMGWVGLGLALAFLLVGAVLCVLLTRRGWRRRDAVLTFVAGHWLVAFAAVVFKRDFDGAGDGRYLVLGVVDLAVGVAIGAAVLRATRPRAAAALTALVAAAVVGNGVVRVLAGPAAPAEHTRQAQTLQALRASGATKGFAQYWAANLYVHQSAGDLQVSEVVCGSSDRLQLRAFLTDTARLAVPARRTFLLWDPAAEVFHRCPRARIDAQLGPPSATLPAPRGTAVLVYPYDVTGRLDPAP